MKKISFLFAAAFAMILASCGSKTAAEQSDSDSVSFEQSQIEEKIMVELDSIADEWNKLAPVEGVLSNGKIQLSEDEIKVKPDYLLDLAKVEDLSLLSQKYRAIGMLTVDKKVAELYKMDVDAYKATLAKLATDVNDPAINIKDNSTTEDLKAFYNAEKENGRINLFWEASAAGIVENLFVLSQNIEKFLPAFDDKAASDFTYHIALLKLALDDLATYDNNIKGIVDVMAPINELNAISVNQFREQLNKMKPQIEAVRAELLK